MDYRYRKLLILGVFSILIIISCSHLGKSGHHVLFSKNDSLSKLSIEFDVPKWAIEEANQGKKFVPGEWIFIPLERGVMGRREEFAYARDPSSIQGDLQEEGFLWPVPSSRRISSPFGKRWGRMHKGIDIKARGGSHILSSQNGVVVYSGNKFNGFGNIIIVAHRYGYFTIYAHNKKNFVKVGNKVVKGQVIGQVGNTGRSTGAHLHYEIRKYNKALNPKRYFKAGNGRSIALR